MSETNGSGTSVMMTLQQVRESILGYVAQGNAGHFHIGRLYNHTVENKLAEKEGFDSAQQFFSQHIKALSQAMLSRCGTVAREFTEQACGKYGVTSENAIRPQREEGLEAREVLVEHLPSHGLLPFFRFAQQGVRHASRRVVLQARGQGQQQAQVLHLFQREALSRGQRMRRQSGPQQQRAPVIQRGHGGARGLEGLDSRGARAGRLATSHQQQGEERDARRQTHGA